MTDTIYSGSVTDFRRQLVQAAQHWDRVQRPYSEQRSANFAARRADPAVPKLPHVVLDASAAGMTAGGYAYTLAAVLAVAEREFGHEVAARLACVADDVLTNGDDHDRNADVAPEVTPGA